MSSELQKQASRENGAKSRGPRTLAGRAHSAGNNCRHNMLARTVVLEGESRERFLALIDSLILELQPSSGLEHCFIETMAVARWRQMRIWGMEKAELALEIDHQPTAPLSVDNQSASEEADIPEGENDAEPDQGNIDSPANFQAPRAAVQVTDPAAQGPTAGPHPTNPLPASTISSAAHLSIDAPPIDSPLAAAGSQSSLKDATAHSKLDAPTRAALALRNVTQRGRSFELMNRYETRYDRQFHSALNRFFQLRENMKISARSQELVD